MDPNDTNLYQAPKAPVLGTQPEINELATRTTRLGAAIVDTIIMLLVMSPLMYFGGYFDTVRASVGSAMPLSTVLLWSVVGLLVFVVVQSVPLRASGQTWGKKVTSIRIVDLQGNIPPLTTLLFKRYLPLQIISSIPSLGAVYALVDSLMIFRRDYRCLHDLMAGTRVIRAG